jgi:DNA-directed RNA polymerase subunit F
MKGLDEVYSESVSKLGESVQYDRAVEELSELVVAIQHFRRGSADRSAVLDQIADVTIMIGQLRTIFGITKEELKAKQNEKILKLLDKLV